MGALNDTRAVISGFGEARLDANGQLLGEVFHNSYSRVSR
jgi:hypothetical protein